MKPVATPPADFSLAQTRRLINDLFTPRPLIYWSDFLASLLTGAVCFGLVRRVPLFSVWQIVFFVASGALYYRAALFIHEIVHFRRDGFRVFRFVWNLLCGIPFLVPSFMYYTHVDHHMRKHYGTRRDGEYLPLGAVSPIRWLPYLCQPIIVPILAVVRFMFLTPLSWTSPRIRAWIHSRASSMAIDPRYLRPLPTRSVLRVIRAQELGCLVVTWGAAALLLRGVLPWTFLLQVYLTSVFVIAVNHVRTMGAHRYRNLDGEMTFLEQLLDSVNHPRVTPFSIIWAPVGLRFHALHHLFPSLPYHALGEAHRRLTRSLPADSPYRLTESPSLSTSLAQLWRDARASRAGQVAAGEKWQTRHASSRRPSFGPESSRRARA